MASLSRWRKGASFSGKLFILRGMRIPAGQHKLEFKFESRSFYLGNQISLVFSIILLLSLAAGLYLEFKLGKASSEEEEA
ncbi:MAG: hypothetical protein R3B93_00310 [Bacteroidia bacterium]